MIITKKWAMPNHQTFKIKPINELLQRYLNSVEQYIVDPFANSNTFATVTNDLSPEFNTDYTMDAYDFLKMFRDESVDVVLYDPPYSLRQVVECYKSVGVNVTQKTTQSSWRSKHIDEISRIVKPNGITVSFGWNSSGVGKVRGFKQIEILLVAHGGSHNDTIVTVEKKK